MISYAIPRFIRYPGGKGRVLNFLLPRLAFPKLAPSRFVEPFVGGGAVFFALSPRRALLSDINVELIDLYRGIRLYATDVWDVFRRLPPTKEAYYTIRGWRRQELDLCARAARTLYLNRTCFKGMWRHNSDGQFNVGYGGEDRRWVVSKEGLVRVATKLRRARLMCADFEEVIDACEEGDLVFLDPPYRPGDREMGHDHYTCGRFTFDDHRRLAAALRRARHKRVRWAMTTSAHPDIVELFCRYHIVAMPTGTGRRIGHLTQRCGEVLIRNYRVEVQQ